MDCPPLTPGACTILSKIPTGQETDVTLVVQLLSIERMILASPARYRVILSDGERFMRAVLAPESTDLLEPGPFQKNIIVGLESVLFKSLNGTSMMYVYTSTFCAVGLN
ncbi:hypothetical protein DFH09DRAFT_1324327 [Mycena vulgaris]|nr:hypothetical protein DFH09DRAFT_1324327 [Mycena vulgaris]